MRSVERHEGAEGEQKVSYSLHTEAVQFSGWEHSQETRLPRFKSQVYYLLLNDHEQEAYDLGTLVSCVKQGLN